MYRHSPNYSSGNNKRLRIEAPFASTAAGIVVETPTNLSGVAAAAGTHLATRGSFGSVQDQQDQTRPSVVTPPNTYEIDSYAAAHDYYQQYCYQQYYYHPHAGTYEHNPPSGHGVGTNDTIPLRGSTTPGRRGSLQQGAAAATSGPWPGSAGADGDGTLQQPPPLSPHSYCHHYHHYHPYHQGVPPPSSPQPTLQQAGQQSAQTIGQPLQQNGQYVDAKQAQLEARLNELQEQLQAQKAQIDTLKYDPFGFGLSAGTACDDLGAATDQQQQQSEQHAVTNNTH